MKLILFNGSPRATKGSTQLFFQYFIKGFESIPGNQSEIVVLQEVSDPKTLTEAFSGADAVLLGFPLYADSMPSIVKNFIEALGPLRGKNNLPALFFLVHSGFPEAYHSRFVEKYLKKMTRRLGCRYIGTIIKGGSEGVVSNSEKANQKLFQLFFDLGQEFAQSGKLNEPLTRQLAGMEHLPGWMVFLFTILDKLGLVNKGWDSEFKKNGVDNHRAQPYKDIQPRP